MTRNLSNLLVRAFDLPEVTVLAARIDSDGCLEASFMSDGHFCAVEEVGRGKLRMVRVDAATAEIQGYAIGAAEVMGIRLDSDDPWGALAGYLRLDMKCSPGNKPCGQRCIPQQQNCSVGGGGMANAKRGVGSSGRSAIREGIDRAKAEIAMGRARAKSRKEQGARAIDEQHRMLDETVREVGKATIKFSGLRMAI